MLRVRQVYMDGELQSPPPMVSHRLRFTIGPDDHEHLSGMNVVSNIVMVPCHLVYNSTQKKM
jgi:hypothetical protein